MPYLELLLTHRTQKLAQEVGKVLCIWVKRVEKHLQKSIRPKANGIKDEVNLANLQKQRRKTRQ